MKSDTRLHLIGAAGGLVGLLVIGFDTPDDLSALIQGERGEAFKLSKYL